MSRLAPSLLLARRVAAVLVLGLVLLTLPLGARAEETGTPGGAEALAEADRLLSLLDQPAVREELRGLLARHLSGEQEAPAADDPLAAPTVRLRGFLQAWSSLDEEIAAVGARIWSGGLRSATPQALLLLAVAALAAWLVARTLRGVARRAAPDPQAPLGPRVLANLLALTIALAVPASYLAALNLAALLLSAPPDDGDRIVAILGRAGLWTLGVAIVVNLFWSPRQPGAGIFQVEAQRARQVSATLLTLTVKIMAIMAATRLLALDGMAPAAASLLGALLSTVVLLGLLIELWRARAAGAAAIQRRMSDRAFLVRSAPLWPLPVSLYLAAIWTATLGSIVAGWPEAAGRLVLSLVVPLVVLGLAAALSRRSSRIVMARGEASPDGAGERPAAIPSLALAAARLSLAVWLVALLATGGFITWLYEFNLGAFLGLDRTLFGAVLQVVCIGLAAYVLYAAIAVSIEVRMARLYDGANPGRARRLRTLLPLLRGFLFYVVLVMAALISLSALGVDIGPLIAGAGIFGLAIGLGTQKLVTDIVSGIFFLLDDAFAIGDYIEVKGLRGHVEAISIRSMKLRHHRGAVHTLPFGEIASLTNHSRDWVIVKLEFRVPAETDLGRVKKIAKTIGQEIAEDPLLGPSLLEPLKSQGVRRVEDNALIIGVKFKAKPGQQFTIRQQVFHRLRDAFQAAGIRFADRGVVVHVSRDAPEGDLPAAAGVAGPR